MSKLKNNDELKLQLLQLVKGNGLSIAEAARQLDIKVRTAQYFFDKKQAWAKEWWEDNQNNIDDYFKGFSTKQKMYLDQPIDLKIYGGTENQEYPLEYGKVKAVENRMDKLADDWGTYLKPKSKILVLDIETRYLTLEGWGMFNQNFSVDQISEDWSILSYSAKWFDSDEVMYSDVSNKTEDDLLQELWELLDEAHFAIAHNGKRFDLKKIRARMIGRGFKPYSPVRIIDTLEICKNEFAFTSNKLLYLTRLLCKDAQKLDHAEFAGHLLWKEFVKGNPDAIRAMREYNVVDVVSLQELYEIIAPWSSKLPNFDIYEDEVDNTVWEEYGYVYTNLAKYQQYRHKVTGQFKRGRTNLLSKEERSKLLANI